MSKKEGGRKREREREREVYTTTYASAVDPICTNIKDFLQMYVCITDCVRGKKIGNIVLHVAMVKRYDHMRVA